MKAFILAAGLGTRLQPLTDKTPKPMLKIGGKPLLEHQINLLKKYGVTEIAMNLFHLREAISGYFSDGSKLGVKINYINEAELSGTAGPLKKLASFFDESFIVIYGDNLTDINIELMAKYHSNKGGLATVALYWEKHPESKGIVVMDRENKILKFKEKPKTEEIDSHYANAGIYICEPEILNSIPDNQFYDFGQDLFPKLIKDGGEIYGYIMEEYLLDIGTIPAFHKAQKDIQSLGI